MVLAAPKTDPDPAAAAPPNIEPAPGAAPKTPAAGFVAGAPAAAAGLVTAGGGFVLKKLFSLLLLAPVVAGVAGVVVVAAWPPNIDGLLGAVLPKMEPVPLGLVAVAAADAAGVFAAGVVPLLSDLPKIGVLVAVVEPLLKTLPTGLEVEPLLKAGVMEAAEAWVLPRLGVVAELRRPPRLDLLVLGRFSRVAMSFDGKGGDES